jgi:dolichol-phosphate mannosyltransferase
MSAVLEPWEVVYVNDGSVDNSLEKLLDIQRSRSNVVVIELSRNWGHGAALAAGMEKACGDAVVLIDGDLQDPPAVIPQLLAEWRRGADVVIAQRQSRSESAMRKLLFTCFYRVLNMLSDYPIPLNAGIFGLMDRKVVDAVKRLPESNRYLPGLRAWVGYQTAIVLYRRAERAGGVPKQTLSRLIKYALDAIFSFSYKPLRLMLTIGLVTAILSFLFGIFLVICRILNIGLFGSPVVYGYTSTLVLVLMLSGVQLTSIGLLGEYIGRIYDEVKHRPLYIIRNVWTSRHNHIYSTKP